MNMTRKNFLRWSAYSAGGIVLGTALPACGGGGGGGSDASAAADSSLRLTPTAVAAKPVPPVAPDGTPVVSGFVASLAASRISGVAPLYVNFDATGTTHHQSTNPTHELFYSWIFGDTGAGNWANGVQSPGLISKNTAFGPVTGHVFETPGTYVVKLAVMDGVNTTTKNVTITVQDPDVVYSGANTICISSSGNFGGAPRGAMQINTAGNSNMFAAFNTYMANNKRILFCKSDAWTCTSKLVFTNLSGITISGYGAGGARASFGSGTLVSVTPSALKGAVFSCNAGNSDIRICNFKIDADSTTQAGGINNSIAGALFCKVEIRGCSAGFSAYPGGGGTNNVFDQHCLYECLVDDLYGYSGVNTPRASATGAIGAPGIFTAVAHPFKVGYKVQLTGTPPVPLATGTNYYICTTNITNNTFTLSTTLGGSAIELFSAGSCTVTAAGIGGGISAFVGLVRGGVMGCYFDSCNHGEQTLRVPFIDRSHINNNYIARPNQGKNILKIHSFAYNEVPLYSEKFVVSANVLDLRGGYSFNGTTITEVADSAMIIGNGGVSGNERVRNGIVEYNFTQGGLGQPKDLVFAKINCPNMTVRNNIADFSLGDRATPYLGTYAYIALNMVTSSTSTPETTSGVRIYSNTLYSNLINPEVASFVRTGNTVSDFVIENNIWYLPNYAGGNKTAIYNTGGFATGIVRSNNTDDRQTSRTSPNFAATPPVLLTDWQPNTGSYAFNGGTPAPVFHVFNQSTRGNSSYTTGAVLP